MADLIIDLLRGGDRVGDFRAEKFRETAAHAMDRHFHGAFSRAQTRGDLGVGRGTFFALQEDVQFLELPP